MGGTPTMRAEASLTGDRITLAEDGPCFLFEYQQLTASPVAENESKPLPQRQTIKEFDYWLEIFPTLLVIEKKLTITDIVMGVIASGITICFLASVFILAIPLILLLFAFLCAVVPWETYYKFDLENNILTVGSQSPVDLLLRRYRYTYYPLKEFTAVRLEKSRYEGDEGTKYDEYSISLERVTGKALKLEITWHNKIEKAKEMVNLIEEYLQRVQDLP